MKPNNSFFNQISKNIFIRNFYTVMIDCSRKSEIHVV